MSLRLASSTDNSFRRDEALRQSAPSIPPSPRRAWAGLLFLGLLIGLLSLHAWRQTFPSVFGSGDFIKVYYSAAAALKGGVSEYSLRQSGDPIYLYPPMLSLILRPLTYFTPETAAKVWFFFCLACLLLAVYFHGRAMGLRWSNIVEIGVTLVVGFHFVPTQMDFGLGQVQMPMLALLCAAWLADRRDRLHILAALLAAAALIKTWMLGALLYLLLRRRPREFATGVAVYAAGIIISFTLAGWSEFRPFFIATLGATHSHWALENMNQAIIQFARLHFAPNRYVHPLLDSRAASITFIITAYTAIAAGTAYAFAQSARARHARPLGLGTILAAVLMISPLYEQIYCVLLLPMLWCFLTGRWGIPFALCALPIYWVFTRTYGTFAPFPTWQQQGIGSLVPSAFGLATFGLWLLCLFAIRTTAAFQHDSSLAQIK